MMAMILLTVRDNSPNGWLFASNKIALLKQLSFVNSGEYDPVVQRIGDMDEIAPGKHNLGTTLDGDAAYLLVERVIGQVQP